MIASVLIARAYITGVYRCNLNDTNTRSRINNSRIILFIDDPQNMRMHSFADMLFPHCFISSHLISSRLVSSRLPSPRLYLPFARFQRMFVCVVDTQDAMLTKPTNAYTLACLLVQNHLVGDNDMSLLPSQSRQCE